MGVASTNLTLVIGDIPQTRLARTTLNASETDVHAASFGFAASSGSGTVASIQFSENFGPNRMVNPRLYLDTAHCQAATMPVARSFPLPLR